jgi:hypothetical protein
MIKNKTQSAFFVFFVAFVIRIFLIFQPENKYLGGNDAIGYNNAAVHLVNGENNFGFFREPGYIYFIAGVYSIWESFGGSTKEISNEFLDQQQNPEIVFLRIIQALFGSFSIVLFYFLIQVYLKNHIALFIAIISGLYLPLANMSLYILRETIQFFILMLLNWFLLKYFISKQLKYLLFSGVIWGLSNLILQITWLIFIPYLIVFLLIAHGNLLFTLRDFLICSLLMIIIILPWLCKSYNYYSDFRILKTMGISLTFESANYVNKLRNSRDLGFISGLKTEEQLKKEWYLISDSSRFERSFSGYYKTKADSIDKVLNASSHKSIFFQKASRHFRLSMMQTFFWKNPEQQINPIAFYRHQKRLIFVIIYFLFSYLSILSFILFGRKLILLLPLFIFFSSLFYFIGSETRRMLFIHPFLIMFSTMALVYIYFKVFKKTKDPLILNAIFN